MVDHINVNCNYKVVNLTVKVLNDGSGGSLLNATLELFETIENFLASIIVRVPANEKDKNYQKEFYRTTIDFKKVLKGIQPSFVAKVIMENFQKAADFEVKFPFQKVKQ